MKVSVIIPVYQVEEYLKKCVDSVLNQTYKDMEVILIDDGSKDSSGKICDNYADSDTRVSVIHKKNGGLMSAWMAGVQVSSGDYLFFVDSDDWIDEDMLEKMIASMTMEDVDLVCCNYYIEYENGKFADKHTVSPGRYDKKKIQELIVPQLISDGGYLSRGIRICRWAKLIKKSLIIENLKYCNFELSIGEDMNIIVPTILSANSLYIMEDSYMYHYRMNQNSIMKKMSPNMWNQVRKLYETMSSVAIEIKKESLLPQIKKDFCDLSVMVIEKELRQLSMKKDNLSAIYMSEYYELLKNEIDVDKYLGCNRWASYVIKYQSCFMYVSGKMYCMWISVLNIIKKYIKKYRS